MPGRPLGLSLKLGWYLLQQKIRGREHYPLTMILEPLEECNLTCTGCGRIREYEPIIERKLTVEQCVAAVDECNPPVVSIAGGEPLMHPAIGEIVARIVKQKRYVYLCTNALLYRKALRSIEPSPYFSFVVHLDGLRETHDVAVERKGVYDVAIKAIEAFRDAGHRVCTNTTLFSGNEPEEYHRLFAMLNEMGVEGMMVSPGFQYEEVRAPRHLPPARRGAIVLPPRLRRLPRQRSLLPQPALPRLSHRRPRVRVHAVEHADLHAGRLAQALLPHRRRARDDLRPAHGDRLEGLRPGQGPAL